MSQDFTTDVSVHRDLQESLKNFGAEQGLLLPLEASKSSDL